MVSYDKEIDKNPIESFAHLESVACNLNLNFRNKFY